MRTDGWIPAAVALCCAGGSVWAGPEVPEGPGKVGLAGAMAGMCGDWLVVGGGANFPDGKMPWDGGKKVWHREVYGLEFRSEGRRWKSLGELPAANAYGVSFSVDGGVVMVGGSDEEGHHREVWRMERAGEKLKFEALPALPEPLAQMGGVLLGKRIHVIGGITRPDAVKAEKGHWVLDLDDPAKGWVKEAELPGEGRILPCVAGWEGKFYVAGGCALAAGEGGAAERTYLKDAWCWEAGVWKACRDLPEARAAAAIPAPAGEWGWDLISGDDGRKVPGRLPKDHPGFGSGVLRYRAAEDRWVAAPELEEKGRVTLPVVPYGEGYFLVQGEVRPGVRTPQVLWYQPGGGR